MGRATCSTPTTARQCSCCPDRNSRTPTAKCWPSRLHDLRTGLAKGEEKEICSRSPYGLSGMFGENDPSSTKPLVEAARNGKFRFQMGDGRNLFDRTYIGNVVQAHIRAANALLSVHGSPGTSIPPDQRVDGEAFLITNDEPTPCWETSRAIGAAAGHPTPTEHVRIIPK